MNQQHRQDAAGLPASRRDFLLRTVRLAGGAGALGLLAGCAGGEVPFGEAPAAAPAPPPTAATAGDGDTVVALLLPLGAPGNAGVVAQSMKNAAELAIVESGSVPIRLVVKDDGGTAQGARMAAQAAIGEGARLVLGPLFAHSVAAAAEAARAARVPMVAFSTDANVAGNGVFLLSFLPQGDVERIVRFEVQAGRRSFAALLPDNAYGAVVEGAFQQAVADSGGRVVGLERFSADPARAQEAVTRLAALLPMADVLFLPDSADGVIKAVQMLSAQGADLRRLRLAGTGVWDDPRLLADPLLEGAQFAGPDRSGWGSFVARYRARYSEEPVRTATLAYDAVSLAAAIVRVRGAEGLDVEMLTSPAGFAGVDGPFRFLPNGTAERSLAVMEIRGGAVTVASPPPAAFLSAVQN